MYCHRRARCTGHEAGNRPSRAREWPAAAHAACRQLRATPCATACVELFAHSALLLTTMPPKRVGGRTGPQLPVELQEELGMDDRRRGGKRKAAPLSRKEQRKQARQMKKQRKVGSAYTSSAAPEVRSVTPASGERATANRPAKGQKRPKRSEFGGNPLFEKLLQDSQLLPGGTTPEDEEIAYLERKLGLAKGSQKARGKKQAEFDRSLRSIGLGALSTLLSDLDGPAPARGGAAGESEDEMGSDSDAEASSGVEASGDAEASSDVEAASGAEAETDTGRAGSGTAAARAATPKRDLYGRDLPARCAAGAYVPPHMRAAAGGRSEAFMRLQRQVRGLLNRLGEANVEPVAMELAQLYRQHSRNDMNTILWEAVAALAVGRQQLQVAFIRVFAALVAGLHILVGVEVGAHVLERAVLHFLDCYTVAKAGEGGDKRPANALLLVVFLYAHSLVHCSLVLELVRSLVASFTELDVELLLLVMKYSGFLLRSDDPAALRDVVREAQDRAKALVAQQAGGATGDAGVCAHAAAADAAGAVLGVDDLPAGLTTRLRFMLDTITDLKNNRKRRHHEELDEREKRLRTWVQRTRQRHSGSGGAAAVLRVGVADLQQAEERGRWWLPGARWVQGSGPVGAGGERSQADDEEQEQLLELAKSQRMNTGVRRCVVA